MIPFDHVIILGEHRSDSIKCLMVGPWVESLRCTFEEIDYVRRERGFDAPYVSMLARKKEDGASP
jgi:hypothetical protein